MKFERLHYLRGFASLAVALSHIPHWQFSVTPIGDAELRIYMVGTVAVWIFFVLSGYLMASLYQHELGRPECFREYAVKRACRIFPVYWFYLVVTVVIYATTSFPRWIDSASMNLGRSLSAITLLPFSADAANMVPNDWTLFHEISFYIVIGALILSRWVGGVIAIAFFAASLLYSKQLLFCVAVVNIYFFIGVVIALVAPRMRLRPSGMFYLSCLSVLLLVFTILSRPLPRLHNFHMLAGLIGVSLLVLSLVGLDYAGGSTKRRRGVFGQILGYLGDVSYSLYLGHTLVQGALYLLIGPPNGIFEVIAYGLGPVLPVYFTYRFVEKPAMQWARLLCHAAATRSVELKTTAAKQVSVA